MPIPERPKFPDSYGDFVPFTANTAPQWEDTDLRLEGARNYWVAVVSDRGEPRVAPVWGVWLDQEFWFAADPRSAKGRAIGDGTLGAVHLESGDDVVIVNGLIEPMRAHECRAMLDAYYRKYEVDFDPAARETRAYRLRPRTVLAWREDDFHGTAVRWRF
jgi:hypothetical protein